MNNQGELNTVQVTISEPPPPRWTPIQRIVTRTVFGYFKASLSSWSRDFTSVVSRAHRFAEVARDFFANSRVAKSPHFSTHRVLPIFI